LIISYLYDPDWIFEINLRRCGVKNLLCGPAKIVGTSHAARQLARPIEDLGIRIEDFREKIFLRDEDRQFAREFLRPSLRPIIAIHPGSGSKAKNWPVQNWIELFSSDRFSGGEYEPGRKRKPSSLVIVSGESDRPQVTQLEHAWKNRDVRFAKDLRLPHLAAVLEHATFVGHDSGISHLAAAAGAQCILLFGPTDPKVWAPMNENVQVLRSQSGRVNDLAIARVEGALAAALSCCSDKNARDRRV
jgi:heptosyltransferase-2